MTDRHPSDEALAAAFEKNRPDYEQVATWLMAEDRVTRVAHDFARLSLPDGGAEATLPEERWRAYRAAFSRLGLESGIERFGTSVAFYNSSRGIVTSGSSKGLLRSPIEPAGLTSGRTEDACGRAPCEAARRIVPGWYITLSRH